TGRPLACKGGRTLLRPANGGTGWRAAVGRGRATRGCRAGRRCGRLPSPSSSVSVGKSSPVATGGLRGSCRVPVLQRLGLDLRPVLVHPVHHVGQPGVEADGRLPPQL